MVASITFQEQGTKQTFFSKLLSVQALTCVQIYFGLYLPSWQETSTRIISTNYNVALKTEIEKKAVLQGFYVFLDFFNLLLHLADYYPKYFKKGTQNTLSIVVLSNSRFLWDNKIVVNILYVLCYLINKTTFKSNSFMWSLNMKMTIFIVGEGVERNQDMP